jgi:DNA-binding NarL/FixJ family response regulator
MTTRVVLADDHSLILDGLERLFEREPDIEVVARCLTGTETLEAVRAHQPDLVVLDLKMPVPDGLAVLRILREEGLATRGILLTAAIDDDEVLEALQLGVGGILLKEMAPRLLVQCVRKVARGEQWLEKESAGRVLEKLLRRDAGTRELQAQLTPRELEMVRLVMDGLRNREIGERLHISEGTVKLHLHNIYEKLGVGGRMELSNYVKARGVF